MYRSRRRYPGRRNYLGGILRAARFVSRRPRVLSGISSLIRRRKTQQSIRKYFKRKGKFVKK